MTQNTITLGEFIDNMEKNGWPQFFGDMFQFDYTAISSGQVKAACALGQARLNTLGGRYSNIMDVLNDEVYDFSRRVIRYNDTYRMSIPEIVVLVREEFKDQLDTELTYTYVK